MVKCDAAGGKWPTPTSTLRSRPWCVCVCVRVCLCVRVYVRVCVRMGSGAGSTCLLEMDTCRPVCELLGTGMEYISELAHDELNTFPHSNITRARAQLHAQGPSMRQRVQSERMNRNAVWRCLFESPAVLDAAQLIGAYGLMQRISFQDRVEDDFLSF